MFYNWSLVLLYATIIAFLRDREAALQSQWTRRSAIAPWVHAAFVVLLCVFGTAAAASRASMDKAKARQHPWWFEFDRLENAALSQDCAFQIVLYLSALDIIVTARALYKAAESKGLSDKVTKKNPRPVLARPDAPFFPRQGHQRCPLRFLPDIRGRQPDAHGAPHPRIAQRQIEDHLLPGRGRARARRHLQRVQPDHILDSVGALSAPRLLGCPWWRELARCACLLSLSVSCFPRLDLTNFSRERPRFRAASIILLGHW
jgi:hypothetical protein